MKQRVQFHIKLAELWQQQLVSSILLIVLELFWLLQECFLLPSKFLGKGQLAIREMEESFILKVVELRNFEQFCIGLRNLKQSIKFLDLFQRKL